MGFDVLSMVVYNLLVKIKNYRKLAVCGQWHVIHLDDL